MKEKNVFFGILFCLSMNGLAQLSTEQEKQVDSLKQIIATSKIDTTIVKAYLAWDNMIYFFDAELDLELNQKVANICKKNLEKKLTPSETNFFQTSLASALNVHGIYYFQKGDYANAINYYAQSRRLYEVLNFKIGIAHAYNNIGAIYKDQLEYELAIEQFNQSLMIYKSILDTQGLGVSYLNIAIINESLGNNDSAMYFLELSLSMAEAAHDPSTVANVLLQMGSIYEDYENYDSAMTYYTRSLEIHKRINDVNSIANSYNNIASVYQIQGNYDQAIKYANQALEIAEKIGSKPELGNATDLLHNCYREKKQYKLALEMYELHIATRDTMNSEQSRGEVMRQKYKYEYESQVAADSIKNVEQEKLNQVIIAQKDAELKVKKNQQYALYGGLILVALFSLFMYNRFRITRKQKQIIEEKKNEVEQQKEIIVEKHKEITDSINYAERIQRALMASETLLNENLKDYFVYLNPKEAVSGDFYWASKLQNNRFCLVVADSTGHGVPGAIMSILNIASLDKAVTKGISEPELILNETRNLIIANLKHDGSEEGGKDGMDCSLISFDFKKNKIEFALANNPIWILRNGELIEFNPDKMPVGKHVRQDLSFVKQTFEVNSGDMIYLFTDGYSDQFGGPQGKKFKYRALKNIFKEIGSLPLHEQEKKLHFYFEEWRQSIEQVDDVCVVGVRV